jgi:hypothetical protein
MRRSRASRATGRRCGSRSRRTTRRSSWSSSASSRAPARRSSTSRRRSTTSGPAAATSRRGSSARSATRAAPSRQRGRPARPGADPHVRMHVLLEPATRRSAAALRAATRCSRWRGRSSSPASR